MSDMIQAHSGTPSQLEPGRIFQLCGEESGKRANSRSFFSFFYSLLFLHQSHHHQQVSHQDNEDDVSPPCWCWVVHSSLSNTQVSCTHSISIALFGRELSCPLIRHWILVQVDIVILEYTDTSSNIFVYKWKLHTASAYSRTCIWEIYCI